MQEKKIELNFTSAYLSELDTKDKELIANAKAASTTAYAPYSGFLVGASILLENGEITHSIQAHVQLLLTVRGKLLLFLGLSVLLLYIYLYHTAYKYFYHIIIISVNNKSFTAPERTLIHQHTHYGGLTLKNCSLPKVLTYKKNCDPGCPGNKRQLNF